VLRTFSKAWGHAAIRLGMAFSSPAVIDYFNKVKYPYNVNRLTQQCALELLSPERIRQYHDTVSLLKSQRAWLIEALKALPIVSEVFPTDANFILVRVDDADLRYAQLRDAGIIVRNRTRVALCKNCLRITVGTVDENRALIAKLKEVSR
jgi:histidinol-phosphate aminotransferase